MIFYAYDTEQWEDDNDYTFSVPMTPEGGGSELSMTFDNQKEFFMWHNTNESE